MKYFIIAGEKSGDMHAANLAKAIYDRSPQTQLVGWGGDAMQKAGVQVSQHYKAISFMGFLEVLTNLSTIFRYLKICKQQVLEEKPDLIVLVDFAGFNMRIAKFAHQHKIPVHYYISPKYWAWRQNRALKMKKYVEQVYCIMPFEVDFYKKYDVKAIYVGNPLWDAVNSFKPDENNQLKSIDKPIIALLPGSRRQELTKMLPTMLKLAEFFPDYQFVVAGVSELPRSLYELIPDDIPIVFDQTYDLLHNAHMAIVTSGTATLETALFEVPQLVVYQTSTISYQIIKQFIRVPYISLVNLIAEQEIVPEIIQSQFEVGHLREALTKLLEKQNFQEQKDAYQQLKEKMKVSNSPSALCAQHIQDGARQR